MVSDLSKRLFLCFLLAAAVVLGAGCSSEKPPFADVYSSPIDGRIVDFGPDGLFAEKREGTVVVGIWELKEDQLSVLKTTYPQAGETYEAKVEVEEQQIRLRPPGADIYQTRLREPEGVPSNEALIGLWKQVHNRGVDLYEFTPWGTVIWVRFANHTGEERIAGGWGKYSTPQPGRLGIKSGKEFDYPINGYDSYGIEVDSRQLKTTNTSTKEVKMYKRIERSELTQIAQTLIAFEPQPIEKKKRRRRR